MLYIGEDADLRRRLGILDIRSKEHPAEYYLDWPPGTAHPHRGHHAAPFLHPCRDAGCAVDVSWSIDVPASQADRRRVEARLIGQYYGLAHVGPAWQHGGRGMAVYLASIPVSSFRVQRDGCTPSGC